MGARDSKPSVIAYEDALKRVPDRELRRIREAFKRCTGANGTNLSLEAFVREVLCDGVPSAVAEWLFQACGGTKRGISFKDLLCAIVVLTKGTTDEKIKFLWTLYVNNQNESGLYIYKWDFARTLHLENSSLVFTNASKTAETLTSLFGSGDRVTFEQFRSWLLIRKNATVMSKWLLSDLDSIPTHDLETPTFYQSLAGVTHLEEKDIMELEKCFWALRNAAPTGQLDAESLIPLLSPPLPPSAVNGVFLAFDENRDGHVDFKELCCGLSAACRGPTIERMKFCFKIFDLDRDGVLNKRELMDMVTILSQVANEAMLYEISRSSTPDSQETQDVTKTYEPEIILLNLKEKLVNAPKKPTFQLGAMDEALHKEQTLTTTTDQDIIEETTVLTLEDFLIWSVEGASALVSPFLDLVVQVCHVVLGLRACRHLERDIVLRWVSRERARGFQVGQFWYLVSSEWWARWWSYCSGPHACCSRDAGPSAPDSFTHNSTESMGSLLGGAEGGSIGSSSSGVSSARSSPPPPRLDNSALLAHDTSKVRSLTGEGGLLRLDVTLCEGRDFELVPDALWHALAKCYGAAQPLPRQVIRPPNSDVELELYPIQLKIYRHVPTTQKTVNTMGMNVIGGGSLYNSIPSTPDKYLAYTAAFSRLATVKQVTEFLSTALGIPRDELRLWLIPEANHHGCSCVQTLLDDEAQCVGGVGGGALHPPHAVLLELRSRDLTWPEEMTQAHRAEVSQRRGTLPAPQLAGATGLHNLGNTCFMNAALQAIWNTGPLTRYFTSGMHLYEINTTNPNGTGGILALKFGELCKEVWSSGVRSVAPWAVRACVSRWGGALAHGQHDAQELLAWLLDALHEDTCRPRPDHSTTQNQTQTSENSEDENWEQSRARSIITSLFYGALKSRVRCAGCGHESVRLDDFNMLSLPLPMECDVSVFTKVIKQDGSIPVRYGVRINSEATYHDLKKKLSELCDIPPECLLAVEVSGSLISRVMEDSERVQPHNTRLCCYEIPPQSQQHNDNTHLDSESVCSSAESGCGSGAGCEGSGAEVSATTDSLCMPALFCFKRSRSEILMSRSPGALWQERSHTLPRNRREHVRFENAESPTLSVKSLNLKPSPRLPRADFNSNCNGITQQKVNYLFAVHRKQSRVDGYFLPWQRSRPVLFGSPLVLGVCAGAGAGGAWSGRRLHVALWAALRRLLSARPQPAHAHNHAQDCDDSLGYEFPFVVRVVSARSGGAWCARCPWTARCRGCAVPQGDEPIALSHLTAPDMSGEAEQQHNTFPDAPNLDSPLARAKFNRYYSLLDDGRASPERVVSELRCGKRRGVPELWLAIDWEPTALHLRYQTSREKAVIEHESVARCGIEAARPIDLQQCLRAFTMEEQLDALYRCEKCRRATSASKKLQIYRLPTHMIIHLKRFQYVNNKWIKSQKVVNFPFENLDPTPYLAAVPQETILRARDLKEMKDEGICDSSDDEEVPEIEKGEGRDRVGRRRRSVEKTNSARRQRLISTSLAASPVCDDNLVDYHRHQLLEGGDPFDLKYRLYAVVSHSGQMSGGHYVAYARNPSGAWLQYNDSCCRELPPSPSPPIDPATAYLLFYERQGLHYDKYMPDVTGKEPVIKDPSAYDVDDSELKKMCCLM